MVHGDAAEAAQVCYTASVMPDIQSRRNWALWLGFLLSLGALLCNAVFFVNPPGQRAILWLSVLLAGVS